MVGRALVTLLASLALLVTLGLGTAAAQSAWLVRTEPAGANTLGFGPVEVYGESAPLRITVQNWGSAAPHNLQLTLIGSFWIISETGSLAPGGTKTWELVARPELDDVGGCSGTFNLDWQDFPGGDDRTMQVLLGCDAIAGPYQGMAPMFGDVTVGTTATLTVPLTNPTAAPRTITSLAMSAASPFSVSLHGGTLPITVPPGGTFEVDITFSPVQVALRSGALVLTDGDGPHYAFHALGNGVPAPLVSISTTSIAFGDVFRHPSVPASATVQLTNVGSVVATIPAATLTGEGFEVVAAPLPGPLQPQQAVTFTIAFDPSAVGTYAGTLTLGSFGSVALSGSGVLRPVSATAPDLDLGAAVVNAAVRRSLSLHNAGTVSITASSIEASDARFRVTSTDRVIPPGGDLDVEIEYAPSALGADLAELSIAFDGDPEPQLVVTLRGTGVMPEEPQPQPQDPPPSGGGCAAHGGANELAGVLLLALVLAGLRRRRR